MNITLSPTVRDILERSTITENCLVLPPGQLERSIYEDVNKALAAAGGKWSRKSKGHLFDGDPRSKLGLMLETGVAVDERKKFQAFYTPPGMAREVAMLADVAGHTVLEPSAGKGALADACMAAGAKHVQCVELDPEKSEVLRIKNYPVITYDFLLLTPNSRPEGIGWWGNFQRIVMNPPFTRNQDCAHVTHALTFLARGGRLAAIMMDNPSRPSFQQLIDGRDYAITKVEAGTFKESGTNIKTIILTIQN